MTTGQRFSGFLSNIRMTDNQKQSGQSNHASVRRCLNNHYYGSSSDTTNSLLIGSWARATRVRPPRDIDVMFVLPAHIYRTYETKTGNKQSQLLQEVKRVLGECFTRTDMSADGQVVLIPFASQAVELVPCFEQASQYKICDTNNGGSWKIVDPAAQQQRLSQSDSDSNGNVRDLVRMLKMWQTNSSVPVKSFWLEMLSEEFINQWSEKGKTTVYYDWMVRDFLKYMIGRAGGYLILPNTYEVIMLGDSWKSKAQSAYDRAVKGCTYEVSGTDFDAWWEWKNIFGDDVPRD